jgi:hypothetical protein
MPVDVRREMAHIYKEYQSYYRVIGEEIYWFRFDTTQSRWDDIYDEGGRHYLPAIRVPALWVDQIEDPEQYSGEGRRPRQRFRGAVSVAELRQRGISDTETHGRRDIDAPPGPPDPPQPGRPIGVWLDDRLNDVLYYDGRFYSVSNFQIRGRAQFADSIIGISALELIVEDESVFDFFPTGTEFGVPKPQGGEGTPLLGFSGRDNQWALSFDALSLSGAKWFMRLFNEGTLVGEMEVDATGAAAGTLMVSLSEAAAEELGPGTYQWTLVQQYGVASNVVDQGTLYLLEEFPEPISITGDEEGPPEVELVAVRGAPTAWALSLDDDLSGTYWAAGLYLGETQLGYFTVDLRFLSDGLVVLLLSEDTVDGLDVEESYVWALYQTVDPTNPVFVAGGPFVVQE